MRALVVALALPLAACWETSPSAPPLAPPPSSTWQVLYGTLNGPLTNGPAFDFPQCAPATACSVNYVEKAHGPVASNQSVSISYEITGNAPVFDYHTNPNNTCDGKATLTLLLQRAGDNLSYEFYRWFAVGDAQELRLGGNSLNVPIDPARWTSVYGKSGATATADWAAALANIGNVGFVFGGGCFAGHGVAVTSGSARFDLKSYSVQ